MFASGISATCKQQARLLNHSRDFPASSRLECGPHLCSCSSCMLQSCRCQNADIKMPHVTWEAVRQHINCDRNVHWRCLLQASAMCEQHMRQQARLLIHSRDSLLARSQLECGPHLCSCSSCMLQWCRCQNANVKMLMSGQLPVCTCCPFSDTLRLVPGWCNIS